MAGDLATIARGAISVRGVSDAERKGSDTWRVGYSAAAFDVRWLIGVTIA